MPRTHWIETLLLTGLAGALAFFGYIAYQAIPKPPPAPIVHQTFDGALALEHAAAQVQLGPRPTGSEANLRLGDYITSTLQSFGWQTTIQPFTYRGVPARNILARPPARPRTTADQRHIVLLGAHYDTRRFADSDPVPTQRIQPVLGANDGASGVAVLLELARSLDPQLLQDEIWLAFFDAEDNGRIEGWEFSAGSTYMAQHLSLRPAVVVIVDMVGDADQQLYLERNSDQEIQTALWRIAAQLGYDANFISQPKWTMVDDHIPFRDAGIPAVDIIDFDYPSWHTTQDTLDKLSAASLERVGRVLEYWLEEAR